jgi:small subunit ribosomal protein S6
VKRYEALFILNTAGREEGVQEIIDKLRAELAGLGAKIETVQKMEKRLFARVADHVKIKEGYYVNYIFEAPAAVAVKLQKHFALHDEVLRLLVTEATASVPAK